MLRDTTSSDTSAPSFKIELIIALVFSLAIFGLCLLYDGCLYHKELMFYLSLPVMFWSGRSVFIQGFQSLAARKLNYDVLAALGAGVAFLLSIYNTFFPFSGNYYLYVYYEPAVVIVTLSLLGKYFIYKASGQYWKEITRFKDEVKEARMLHEDKEVSVPLENIRVGDMLLVKPNEIFPADGIIIDGVTEADESFIKRPSSVRKYPGDEVIGGSLNRGEKVRIKVVNAGRDAVISKLARILDHRRNRQMNEADKFAARYIPLLLLAALLTSAGWFIVHPQQGAPTIIRFALEVIIVGTPCALAIAVPIALNNVSEKLINKGILVRNLNMLEKLQRTNTLVVDKSGILTAGKPEVAEVIWKGDAAAKKQFISVIFSIQRRAADEKAAAIAEYFSKEGTTFLDLDEMEEFESKGVRATVNGEVYYIGTDAFVGMIDYGRYFKKDEYIIHEVSGMEYFFDDEELLGNIQKLKDAGLTVCLAANSKAVFAIIGLGEGIRKTTTDTMKALKNKNIEVVLMTGESREAAQSVAEELGVKEVYAEVLPFSKSDIIRELQNKGKVVALAGGGVEDAPALAQADTSFSLIAGNDLATENADAVLLDGDISKISEVIQFAGSLKQVIQTNILFAVVFNILGIVIASGLLFAFTGMTLTSAIASLVMAAGTIAVVVNNYFRTKKL